MVEEGPAGVSEEGISIDEREKAVAMREAALASRETALLERETALTTATKKFAKDRADLQAREETLTQREKALSEVQAAIDAKRISAAAEGVTDAKNVPPLGAKNAACAASTAVANETASLHATSAAAEQATVDDKADEQRSVSRRSVLNTLATMMSSRARHGLAFQVRFIEEKSAQAPAGGAADCKPPPPKGKDNDAREIAYDSAADWARDENLKAGLLRQRADNPDEVFFPLPSQRTCELTDIFSAPRRRERGKGSGEWTPASVENVICGANSHHPQLASQCTAAQSSIHMIGLHGDYRGEVIKLPVGFPGSPNAPKQTIILGRSSSCDVTLARDDQISRRHLQMESRDGKVFAKDLGSTYARSIPTLGCSHSAAQTHYL